MYSHLNEDGKFNHSNIMKNAHAAVIEWRRDNPWMTYQKAFGNALRIEYSVARAMISIFNGCEFKVCTLGD